LGSLLVFYIEFSKAILPSREPTGKILYNFYTKKYINQFGIKKGQSDLPFFIDHASL